MDVRHSSRALCAAVCAAAVWVAGPGVSHADAATAGACHLQGVADISPPLGSSSGSFAYSFTGDLSNCESNVAGAPTSGTVSAGIQLPETVTLTCATGATTGTVLYQQPIAQGAGSCGSSTTAGEALITWGNGLHTVTDYTTTGAAAAVQLEGTVGASMTLTLVASSVPMGCTAPLSFTIDSDEPVFADGQTTLALLTFSPATQDQNCVTVGVSSANIDGIVGIGSAN